MNDTMTHRGPDDRGIWQHEADGYNIGLAQRRLSILDLSESGHQPMETDDGSLVLSYNGEIYNFREIRQELEKEGFRFKSETDTEVILYAYKYWGKEAFSRFNGMFAIALYDKKESELILARDRIGKKPLYYYLHEGTIIFGSELKPLMACPLFHKNVRQDMIMHFLCNKYIVSPDTVFEDTYKVRPGTYVSFRRGDISEHVYWDMTEIFNGASARDISFADAKKELNELLTDAVSHRLIADVPVGTFLSSGIDSAVVTAIANRLMQEQTGRPIDTFTIGFFDKERNEADRAALIAKHIGTNHHELYMGEEDILDMLRELPKYFDEPFADSSQLPTMLLSRLAKENITVALSGDAGDELFCGYKMYDWTWAVQYGDFLAAFENKMPWNKSLAKKSAMLGAITANRADEYKVQLFTDVMIDEAAKLLTGPAANVKFPHERHIKTDNLQEKRMLLDMLTYLPDEILAKTDRASMKYSLEVRCPLTDYRIAEWSFGIPHKYKYHRFNKKYILKQLAYDHVPKNLLSGPKKGFGVPLKKWLRTVLAPAVAEYAEPEKLRRQGIFDPDAVRGLIRRQQSSDYRVYSNLVWGFYIFQSWYDEYIL